MEWTENHEIMLTIKKYKSSVLSIKKKSLKKLVLEPVYEKFMEIYSNKLRFF